MAGVKLFIASVPPDFAFTMVQSFAGEFAVVFAMSYNRSKVVAHQQHINGLQAQHRKL